MGHVNGQTSSRHLRKHVPFSRVSKIESWYEVVQSEAKSALGYMTK